VDCLRLALPRSKGIPMPKQSERQYILLPVRGLVSDLVAPTTPSVSAFLSSLKIARTVSARMKAKFRVLDSIRENGAKLVEMSPDFVSDLRAKSPGLRIVPVVYYFPARAPRPALAAAAIAAGTAVKASLTVVSKKDGRPVPGAYVVAFTDFGARSGASGKTDRKGIASLSLPAGTRKIERLYVYCQKGFWNVLKRNLNLSVPLTVSMLPIDLSYVDCLRRFYGNAPLSAGDGVRVGVIDTGVAVHPDLVLHGGENTVVGEDPREYGDNGEGHGIHVAGIIAARGTLPSGIRGLAPGVSLRSYRVFGKRAEGASNFAIAKAIDRAISDGCDLINMSLGGGPADEATHSAIAQARSMGTLIFAANGNDGRLPVSFPAADSLALAVSALGRKGTFPDGTTEYADIAPPYGKDRDNFVAAFSNIGPETDLIGPGVGILSTFPGGYAVLDGTSMACPAAVGAAAKLLAKHSKILGMARDQARSDAMAALVLRSAKSLGFGAVFEGQGLP
jgi:subtilisin